MMTWVLMLVICTIGSIIPQYLDSDSGLGGVAGAGVQITLRKALLSTAVPPLKQWVAETIPTVAIPDVQGTTDTPMGEFSYHMSKIHLENFDVGPMAVTLGFQGASGMHAALSNIRLRVAMDFNLRRSSWPHLNPTGQAEVDITAQMGLGVTVGVAPSGRPTMRSIPVTLTLGAFTANFHGTAYEWLLDVLTDIYQEQLKDLIITQVQSTLVTQVNQAAADLLPQAPLPAPVPAYPGVTVDWSLIQAPQSSPTAFVVSLKGEFLPKSPVSAPFRPDTLPPVPVDAPHMTEVAVSAATAQSFLESLRASGMSLWVDNSMIPKEVLVNLNTSNWGPIVPQIAADYPNQLMKVKVSLASTPGVKFTLPATAVVDATMRMDFHLADDTSKQLFVADLSLPITSSLTSHGGWVTATSDCGDLTSTLVSTSVGPITLDTFTMLLGLFKSVGVSLLNEKTKDLRIPNVRGYGVSGLGFTVRDGALVAIADFAEVQGDGIIVE